MEANDFDGDPPGEDVQKKKKTVWLIALAIFLVAVAVAGASFYGGMKYQRSREPAAPSTPDIGRNGQSTPMQPGGPVGQDMRGTRGEVTAISSSSISIEDARTGSTTTYNITGSTEILDSDEKAEVSDIEVGDMVMVVASSSDSSAADRIMLNARMGPPGTEGSASPPASSST